MYKRQSLAYAQSQDEKSAYLRQNYLELDEIQAFDAILLILSLIHI